MYLDIGLMTIRTASPLDMYGETGFLHSAKHQHANNRVKMTAVYVRTCFMSNLHESIGGS